MNTELLRERLKTLMNQTKKQDSFWKPTPGKHVIRIVPYKYNKENPFIELLFHYNIGPKPYLSPQTFGRPDPIVSFAEELKSTGKKEDWKLGKSLEPKLRTFVPIVVRGKEEEGVKFWGFGKTVYQELLGLISDPEYGDITDITRGHDITVEFKSAEEVGKSYPSTTIRPKPAKTKLVDGAEQLKALFDTQKNILEIYKEPTYEELEQALANWLKSGDKKDKESQSNSDDYEDDGAPTTVKSFVNAKKESNTASTSKSNLRDSVISSNVDDISDDLDKLFED